MQLHACAVDLSDAEVDAFMQAQAAGVDRAQSGTVLWQVDVREDVPDLVDTQHDGEFVGGSWAEEIKHGPRLA